MSRRHMQVLELICRGASAKEIASACSISYYTAREYVAEVYRTLGVNSKGRCIAEAFRLGLAIPSLPPGQPPDHPRD